MTPELFKDQRTTYWIACITAISLFPATPIAEQTLEPINNYLSSYGSLFSLVPGNVIFALGFDLTLWVLLFLNGWVEFDRQDDDERSHMHGLGLGDDSEQTKSVAVKAVSIEHRRRFTRIRLMLLFSVTTTQALLMAINGDSEVLLILLPLALVTRHLLQKFPYISASGVVLDQYDRVWSALIRVQPGQNPGDKQEMETLKAKLHDLEKHLRNNTRKNRTPFRRKDKFEDSEADHTSLH